jgi:hypothetical protein
MVRPGDLLQRGRQGLGPNDMAALLRRVGGRSDVRTARPVQFQLTGRWWAAWQTWNQGEEIVATQPIDMQQQGAMIRVRALERSEENVRGGYVWAGELRIWDNHVLMGWYASAEPNVRSRGTLFFQLHVQGRRMEGRWIGLSYEGAIVSGWASIARERRESASLVERLKDRGASELG